MTRILALWETIRASYWAVPSLMVLAAVALSVVMVQVDERVGAGLLDRLPWVYAGGPDGARGVLSTIAASMITVAGVTFSITIVALTLASQQFGPRLLRSFLTDRGNQVVLGTFVSAFLYCVLVLRTVRADDGGEFVPHAAVTVGVALAVLGVGVLIFFIHHVATSIQASQIIAHVSNDLERAIDRLFPEKIGEPGDRNAPSGPVDTLPETFDREARDCVCRSSGYVQAIDPDGLMSLARECDLRIRIETEPGSFVREGVVIARVWPGERFDPAQDQRLREAFVLGTDRNPTQDVTFFVNQLVQLAVRALSPGINDPATARMCIERLGEALCRLAGRRIPDPRRVDDDGVLRVVARPVTFDRLADAAFDEIRRYGRGSASVVLQLLDAIGDIASCVQRPEDRRALLQHADLAAAAGRSAGPEDVDAARIAAYHRAALARLHAGDAAQDGPDTDSPLPSPRSRPA